MAVAGLHFLEVASAVPEIHAVQWAALVAGAQVLHVPSVHNSQPMLSVA